MKIVKRILILIVILIAIPMITALFVRNDYSVEREIPVNRSKEEVFNYIRYLKNQDHYSKWASMDPDMKKWYTGTDGTVGFISSWESKNKNVGKGEQEIASITEGERIDFEIRFIEPFRSTSPAYMITERISEDQTVVKWGFQGSMDYPMNIMLLFMNMEEVLGNDLKIGLTNLKAILEKKLKTN